MAKQKPFNSLRAIYEENPIIPAKKVPEKPVKAEGEEEEPPLHDKAYGNDCAITQTSFYHLLDMLVLGSLNAVSYFLIHVDSLVKQMLQLVHYI